MSISFNFSYNEVEHKARLELVNISSEKVISIAGRNYKILGSEEDVSLLKAHISSLKTNDFENENAFKASLTGMGPPEKTSAVYHKTVPSSTTSTKVESTSKIEASEKENFSIRKIIEEACTLIEHYYIFPEKAKEGIQKIREKLQKGHYDSIKDMDTFSIVFTKDLQELIKDKHFDIVVPPAAEDIPPTEEEEIKKLQETNFGITVKKTDSVGYLKFDQFLGVDPAGKDYVSPRIALQTREAFDKAIDSLRGSEAIIIDLRENGGGSPCAVQLLSSYFLPELVALNTIRSRAKNKDSILEFNTLSNKELPKSKRLLDVPLYILTSKSTFSAAEEFTYDMQVAKRAESIGQKTGGGANSSHLKPLNSEGLYINIPDEEAINPHTKTNWEGTGVAPDHVVPADQALNKANELIQKVLLNKKTMMAANKSQK